MILSLAAQAAETVIVRVGFVAIEAVAKSLVWVGTAGYNYMWPPPPAPPTEVESLREEVAELQSCVETLRHDLQDAR